MSIGMTSDPAAKVFAAGPVVVQVEAPMMASPRTAMIDEQRSERRIGVSEASDAA